MSLLKIAKDSLIKVLLGKESVPRGLYEMDRYFRTHGPINFDLHVEGGVTVAVSTDFVYGSIVTSGATPEELDTNIKDAIMTSFEIPSSYAKEADIKKFGAASHRYAAA
jgi:hypothetical protein